MAITPRIVLIENLRRLADQISAARIDRQDANALTDIAARDTGPLSEPFAVQMACCHGDDQSLITWRFGAFRLPGLGLLDGVPSSMRSLIAASMLLTNEDEIREQVERLEVHFLAGIEGDLSFALQCDGLDADSEIQASDAGLLDAAAKAIDKLNQRYGPSPAAQGSAFCYFHRRRQFNPCEQKWMGWERKRGKLHELNRLLRGASDTSYIPVNSQAVWVPEQVRYVIVLDTDTRLPRETAMNYQA